MPASDRGEQRRHGAPFLGRGVVGSKGCRMCGATVTAAVGRQSCDHIRERLAALLPEGRALALAMVGEHHELIAAWRGRCDALESMYGSVYSGQRCERL